MDSVIGGRRAPHDCAATELVPAVGVVRRGATRARGHVVGPQGRVAVGADRIGRHCHLGRRRTPRGGAPRLRRTCTRLPVQFVQERGGPVLSARRRGSWTGWRRRRRRWSLRNRWRWRWWRRCVCRWRREQASAQFRGAERCPLRHAFLPHETVRRERATRSCSSHHGLVPRPLLFEVEQHPPR